MEERALFSTLDAASGQIRATRAVATFSPCPRGENYVLPKHQKYRQELPSA